MLKACTSNRSALRRSSRRDENGWPRLADPMFEHWLRERCLTPAGGEFDE